MGLKSIPSPSDKINMRKSLFLEHLFSNSEGRELTTPFKRSFINLSSILLLGISIGCHKSSFKRYDNSSTSPISTAPSTPPSSKPYQINESEFVSGSSPYEKTPLRKYKILSSAGNFQRELVSKTPRGYTLYSSVQGEMISHKGKGQ